MSSALLPPVWTGRAGGGAGSRSPVPLGRVCGPRLRARYSTRGTRSVGPIKGSCRMDGSSTTFENFKKRRRPP